MAVGVCVGAAGLVGTAAPVAAQDAGATPDATSPVTTSASSGSVPASPSTDEVAVETTVAAATSRFHSRQAEAFANAPRAIGGSGGNDHRQVLVLFDQATYRDVGLPVVGSKTASATGRSVLMETTGQAAQPASGALIDENTCSAIGVTGFKVGLPATASVSGNNTSVTHRVQQSTGTQLGYTFNYTSAFQCRAPSATPVKNTRRTIGQMNWKQGGIQNQTADVQFWW